MTIGESHPVRVEQVKRRLHDFGDRTSWMEHPPGAIFEVDQHHHLRANRINQFWILMDRMRHEEVPGVRLSLLPRLETGEGKVKRGPFIRATIRSCASILPRPSGDVAKSHEESERKLAFLSK